MPYAVVTGASGGIGLSIARELAERKYHLLLVARSKEKLEEQCRALEATFNVRSSYLAVDLSLSTSADLVVQWVKDHSLDVAILVNNAGYGLWGNVEDVPIADLENMMQLNMTTLVRLCHLFIPILKNQPRSYLLNVASTASYQAVPTLTTYAATKAFVVLFTRGLRWELRRSGLSVSCLCPGATSTGFIDRAGLTALKERADRFSMKPEAVARIGVRGMFRGKAEIIPGFMNWLTANLTYFLPKALIEKIAAGLYE
jgi:short-subunit dehydrogenase